MDFIQNNSEWIISVLIIFIMKIIDNATPHMSQVSEGWKKVLLFVVNILNVIKTTPPPKDDKFKEVKIKDWLKGFLPVLFILSLGGCATWQKDLQSTLEVSARATDGFYRLASANMRTACEMISDQCKASEDKQCLNLVECHKKEKQIVDLAKRVLISIDLANSYLVEGNQAEADKLALKALTLMAELRSVWIMGGK
jgi:hypothetical protein